MTPRYPGARFYGGTENGRTCTHRSASWHEAVTTAGVDGLIGWGRQDRSFHMAIARYGDCGQGTDFDNAVNGVADGNGDVLTIETWDDLLPATGRSPDGSHGPNDFAWDAGQCERIADIIAWMQPNLAIPIRRMMNTREAGHAPHRLGVPNPTGAVDVGYGPDRWTAHPGKECCGDMRIRQLFGDDLACGPGSIIFRGRVIAAAVAAGQCNYLPTGPVDVAAALSRTPNGGTDMPVTDAQWSALVTQVTDIQNRIHYPGSGWDNIQDIQAKLKTLIDDESVNDENTKTLQEILWRIHTPGTAWDNIQDIQSKLNQVIAALAKPAG